MSEDAQVSEDVQTSSNYYSVMVRRKKNRCRKVTLYVPAKKMEMVNEAKKIFGREGSSMSKWFVDKLEEHKRLHEPGNPQQRIDVILKIGKAYHAPNPICRVRDCFRNVAKVLNWKKSKTEVEQVGLCEKHAELCLREFPLSYSPILKENKTSGATEKVREVG